MRRSFALLVATALAGSSAAVATLRQSPAEAIPDVGDLKISRRSIFDRRHPGSTTETLYLKGARQRQEFLSTDGKDTVDGLITITQCDRQRTIVLSPETKLFATQVVYRSWTPAPSAPPEDDRPGPNVVTTFDAVDTGERRTIGRYVARRVRTTITIEADRDAATPPSTRETDGWYIDLPGLGCGDADSSSFAVLVASVGNDTADRHHFRTKGTARRGFAIGETTRHTHTGGTTVGGVELVELSDRPLDPALFEIPRDYRPAVPLPGGGHDLSRPDTLVNRLRTYWEGLTSTARAVVRRSALTSSRNP